MGTTSPDIKHLDTLDDADQFKLPSFFKKTIAASEVNKGYARGANDLIEQVAIADAARRWIKGSQVHR